MGSNLFFFVSMHWILRKTSGRGQAAMVQTSPRIRGRSCCVRRALVSFQPRVVWLWMLVGLKKEVSHPGFHRFWTKCTPLTKSRVRLWGCQVGDLSKRFSKHDCSLNLLSYENENVVPTFFSKIWPSLFSCQEAEGKKVQAASGDVA